MMALRHQWNAMLFLQPNKMPFWEELIVIQDAPNNANSADAKPHAAD